MGEKQQQLTATQGLQVRQMPSEERTMKQQYKTMTKLCKNNEKQ